MARRESCPYCERPGCEGIANGRTCGFEVSPLAPVADLCDWLDQRARAAEKHAEHERGPDEDVVRPEGPAPAGLRWLSLLALPLCVGLSMTAGTALGFELPQIAVPSTMVGIIVGLVVAHRAPRLL